VTLNAADTALRTAARTLLSSPLVARALAGDPERNDRGDTLDPTIQAMIRLQALAGPALGDPSPEAARADFRRGCALAAPTPRPITTEDGRFPGPLGPIPYRRYLPVGHELPVLVYFHGGGWAVGGIDTADTLCRHLALDADVEVVSIDYALAPEHPFPAGLRDAHAALDAVMARTDRPVGVGGDSAGGHLSALLAQERSVAWQLLVYPATDLRRLTTSHRTLAHGYVLEKEAIDRYLDWLGADPEDPAASPALRPAGEAPAIVVTCGFDPLRDEGEAYADALRRAEVPLVDLRYPDLPHGFVNMDGLVPRAREAIRQISDALRHVAHPRDTV
jgi:acetyl esterase